MNKYTILTYWQLRYFDWEEMFCRQSSFFIFLYFSVIKINSQKTSFDRCCMTSPWRLHGPPKQSRSHNIAKVREKEDLKYFKFFLKTTSVFYWKLLPTSPSLPLKNVIGKDPFASKVWFSYRASQSNDKCADGSLAQAFTVPNLQSTFCPYLTSGELGMCGTKRLVCGTQVSLDQQRSN